MLSLVGADSREQMSEVRRLFQEYADWLQSDIGIDLAFQDFASELAGLPGEYSGPRGCLILALWDGAVAGCAAMRDLGGGACEMKRMYVRPEFRGRGIGRALAKALIGRARAARYELMRLDTDASMHTAITLYRALGFKPIGPYRYNPYPGATFMELALSSGCGVS